MTSTRALTIVIVLAFALAAVATILLFSMPSAHAQGPVPASPGSSATHWGYLAAALATGLSTLGAGYAVGAVGSAAVGAMAEKPELLGRLLILIGLAEGIAIYGLIISILILNRI
ncbi:ATP synthase subunit C [Thermithiobacillus plumbiphilus]|uniref:ATP synthase subunit C n=1 Tax=Thermithiobacillus plumbiphilus TaxID=1729899 RepID=A0ABU9D6E5_9PROT